MIRVYVEVSQYFPLHEYMREMNGIEQSTSTSECIVLRALNVYLHNSLTERYNVHKVVKDYSANDSWTRPSALLYLQHKHYYETLLTKHISFVLAICVYIVTL